MQALSAAKWIGTGLADTSVFPVFERFFSCANVRKATLTITALGVYEARLNGERVGDFVMAPGWTSYASRLQVQKYDITGLLQPRNALEVSLGRGWYASRLGWKGRHPGGEPLLLLAEIHLVGGDGREEIIATDEGWSWRKSPVLYSEIYEGEAVDLREAPPERFPVAVVPHAKHMLIKQEGEIIRERETLRPLAVLRSPEGDPILDFGQNLAGYVAFRVTGQSGRRVVLRHGEILRQGALYTDNLRDCRAEFSCVLRDGEQFVKPRFTFFGFRYVQLSGWPEPVSPENFTAIAVYSDMKRTGFLRSGHAKLNKLFENILWGQRGNFLDVPTDCPQRDERLGWTGDAQVFVQAAAYHYDVKRFFAKWLADLRADQFPCGAVPAVVPNVLTWRGTEPDRAFGDASAAWGDAACICPWTIYLTYGDKRLLAKQYESMRGWVSYIQSQNREDGGLWIARGKHFGDWLGLDAPAGSYKGGTDESLIATAMYANSVALLAKAGRALGKDARDYEDLHGRIVRAFRDRFVGGDVLLSPTQTGYALALHFHLFERPAVAAAALADMVRKNGDKLTTGFVGTPYLLHALSENGYGRLAYSLLLQEEFPSWLYSVNMGATTIWEHWDGIRPDGSMWDAQMNSFNHYAYGAVSDWLFGVAAGIRPVETHPGYEKALVAPLPDERLGFLSVRYQTPHGVIHSQWHYQEGRVHYRVAIPKNMEATVILDGQAWEAVRGRTIDWEAPSPETPARDGAKTKGRKQDG